MTDSMEALALVVAGAEVDLGVADPEPQCEPAALLSVRGRTLGIYRKIDGTMGSPEGFVVRAEAIQSRSAVHVASTGRWLLLEESPFVDSADADPGGPSFRSKIGGVSRNDDELPRVFCDSCSGRVVYIAQFDPVELATGGAEFYEMLFVMQCPAGCTTLISPELWA